MDSCIQRNAAYICSSQRSKSINPEVPKRNPLGVTAFCIATDYTPRIYKRLLFQEDLVGSQKRQESYRYNMYSISEP